MFMKYVSCFLGLTSGFYLLRAGTGKAKALADAPDNRGMKKKLYIYRFSDGSCVVDDVDGAKANVHAFWHPEAECVSVEDFRG